MQLQWIDAIAAFSVAYTCFGLALFSESEKNPAIKLHYTYLLWLVSMSITMIFIGLLHAYADFPREISDVMMLYSIIFLFLATLFPIRFILGVRPLLIKADTDKTSSGEFGLVSAGERVGNQWAQIVLIVGFGAAFFSTLTVVVNNQTSRPAVTQECIDRILDLVTTSGSASLVKFRQANLEQFQEAAFKACHPSW